MRYHVETTTLPDTRNERERFKKTKKNRKTDITWRLFYAIITKTNKYLKTSVHEACFNLFQLTISL